jgi:carbamoyl-phosphate synthase large subunit
MNPRVSRSSALASKATGFPIAKVAAKLAVGYTLDELRNEITGGATPASFEPTIDYVVTKIPRFAFEKFPATDARLTTQMKSVGEVMAIGRNFQESLQKALRGLETGKDGLNPTGLDAANNADDLARLKRELREPKPDRIFYVADAFRAGLSLEEIYAQTHIDRWFLDRRDGSRGAQRRSWRDRGDAHARAQTQGLLRRASRRAARHRRGRGAHAAPRVQRAARVQARRFVRGRVRDDDRVSLFDLRGRVRGTAFDARQDHGARRRSQPHRPGHRVRLLLRACRARAARRRL